MIIASAVLVGAACIALLAALSIQRRRLDGEGAADGRHQSGALLEERANALTTTLQHIDQGVIMVDAAGIVAVYNQRVLDMLNWPEELLASRPPFTAVLEYQWEHQEFSRTDETLRDFVRAGGIIDKPQLYVRERPNGTTIEVRSQPLGGGGVVRTFTDVTERRVAEQKIERAAMVDELTGLPTRLALRRQLEDRLAGLGNGRPTLLYLNLDRFRLLNDARGHDTGDRVLKEVARRLAATCPPSDVVSRVGGDEFAILHCDQMAEGGGLAERLLRVLAQPHVIEGVRLSISASIGVVIPVPGTPADTALQQADIALNRAKDGGRNQVSFYTPSMAADREERFQLEQSLREAIGSQAFRLAYQPIVNVETGQIVGYEALLRWTDRVRGEVSPSVFIPMAEATGLIVPLGRSVLEWACFEAASWPTDRTVAVNLSPAQFHGDELVETIRDVLARSGLPPERLECEVTEGILLADTGPVLETMRALREIGVALTLDDFGAGHAGLSYLRRFPFQKMKIDGSFVRTLGQARESDAIIEAILLLGHRLEMRVVAEGVETDAQLEQLRRMKCPLVQGYLTGRPMAPELARALP